MFALKQRAAQLAGRVGAEPRCVDRHHALRRLRHCTSMNSRSFIETSSRRTFSSIATEC